MARSVRSIVLLAAAVFLSRCAGCGSSEEPPCPSGQEQCSGVCRDPATYASDASNCGACGISCGNGTCSGGQCQCGAETYCPSANPRCADLQTDRRNCGACGAACTVANEVCQAGTCFCPLDPCNGGAICTDLQTDAANCGTCGRVCPLTNEVCVDGGCTCPAGLPDTCDSKCVSFATDPANCGSCAHGCATGQVCTAGQCVCPAGTTLCSGACVDLATDEQNCGSCGHGCATGATCTNNSCAACPAGAAAGCGGTCCGGGATCCGTACPTEHSNGLGQHFYDCVALGTYDGTQAQSAARAWQPSGTPFPSLLPCPGACLGWQTPAGTSPASCATWCWSGAVIGRAVQVQSLVCVCPSAASPTWQ